MTEYVSVADYYTEKNIFITGATGFIGKVLIEKLLRSCPNIGNLYLLVRAKKSKDPYERITEMSKCTVFDRIRKENPTFHKKLIPIQGEITEDKLGIKQDDIQLLENKIHVVFHSAATIKFDEPLRVAMDINVLGVRKMIHLCNNFKNLEALVHVSTAYSNCEKSFIEEKVYTPPLEPQKLIDAMEWLDEEIVDSITPSLVGNKPNTYTYTKHLAEHLLLKEGHNLPLAIVRPSIVGAAWQEPCPGWIENYNGPSGVCIATGKGLLRTMRGDSSGICDLIPVDFPVNMLITVGWYTAVYKPRTTLIYHSTIGNVNPLTWGEMINWLVFSWKKNPSDSCFRRPRFSLTRNRVLQSYYVAVCHLIPAYIADLRFRLVGKRPRMVPIYRKLHKLIETLSFFTSNSWEWTYSNLDMLKNHLSSKDRKCFYIDPRELHWPSYMETFCLGAKQYILKEDLSDLPEAKAHLRKLRNIRYTFNTVLIIAVWRIVIAKSDLAIKLWRLILNLVTKFLKFFRLTSVLQS